MYKASENILPTLRALIAVPVHALQFFLGSKSPLAICNYRPIYLLNWKFFQNYTNKKLESISIPISLLEYFEPYMFKNFFEICRPICLWKPAPQLET